MERFLKLGWSGCAFWIFDMKNAIFVSAIFEPTDEILDEVISQWKQGKQFEAEWCIDCEPPDDVKQKLQQYIDSNFTPLEKKVLQLAWRIGKEWDVVDSGYTPSKHERIVKTFHNVAWGILSKKEWEQELQKWVKILQQYNFDKFIYKTATKKGSSRLYLIKYSS